MKKVLYSIIDNEEGHENVYLLQKKEGTLSEYHIDVHENNYANDRSRYASYNSIKGYVRVEGDAVVSVTTDTNQNYTNSILMIGKDIIIDKSFSFDEINFEDLSEKDKSYIDRQKLIEEVYERN